MKKYHIVLRSFIPSRIDEVWDMAANPSQLVVFTPKLYGLFLKEPSALSLGRTIHAGIGLDRLHFDWKLNVESLQAIGARRHFAEVQAKGPFSFWKHEHNFEEKSGGVMLEERVTYSPPFKSLKSLHPILNLAFRPTIIFLLKERHRRIRQILDRRKLGWKESYSNI